MFSEVTGRWEDLVTREEFRGHQVKIIILDEPSADSTPDEWLESLRQMAAGGVRISHPADDSRDSIYEAG